MKHLVTIETEGDLIVVCRLLNVLRRKGVELRTLVLSLGSEGYTMMALIDAPESDAEHLYHFLRRTEGVFHVTSYRHQASGTAAFVFVEGDAESRDVARVAALLPGSKLVFASDGKALFESAHSIAPALDYPGVLPFARVRTTRPENASSPRL
ncbi:MAG: hypothetical protein ACRD3D_10745 [Terriglobia bacterium]